MIGDKIYNKFINKQTDENKGDKIANLLQQEKAKQQDTNRYKDIKEIYNGLLSRSFLSFYFYFYLIFIMKGNFRSPEFVKRYEYSYFDLQTPLNANVGANNRQTKDNYLFAVDNSSETNPIDWYNSYLAVNFNFNWHIKKWSF